MKKNNQKTRKNYHKFLVKEEQVRQQKSQQAKAKRDIKQATAEIEGGLQLEDNFEIKMGGVSKIITRNAHKKTMKKKIRKWKKEPVPVESMEIV